VGRVTGIDLHDRCFDLREKSKANRRSQPWSTMMTRSQNSRMEAFGVEQPTLGFGMTRLAARNGRLAAQGDH